MSDVESLSPAKKAKKEKKEKKVADVSFHQTVQRSANNSANHLVLAASLIFASSS
jgi:DNA-binding FadR family transcriptional regulator